MLVKLQQFLPQHGLTKFANWLSLIQITWLKNLLIRLAIKQFKIDLNEAKQNHLDHYPHFNAFFTRALKSDARPIDANEKSMVSPADSRVSQWGDIQDDRLIQAKGKHYQLAQLLGHQEHWAKQFQSGQFITLYLSPRDYHRVHMPLDGQLLETCHIPGRLFSVSPKTLEQINSVFAGNERLVSIFQGEHGPFAVIMVGAMMVSGIETIWGGRIYPPRARAIQVLDERQRNLRLTKGEEMGRFNYGSTVILLLPQNQLQWQEFKLNQAIRMGEALGHHL